MSPFFAALSSTVTILASLSSAALTASLTSDFLTETFSFSAVRPLYFLTSAEGLTTTLSFTVKPFSSRETISSSKGAATGTIPASFAEANL